MIIHDMVELDDRMTPVSFATAIGKALRRSKVVVGRAGERGRERALWDTVTNTLGRSVDMAESTESGLRTGEKWMDIRFDARMPMAYRHAKVAQPLHTDGSYIADYPDVVTFYCVSQAASGGETVFFDADDLIAVLRDRDAALLARLQSTPVTYAKRGDRKRRPILTSDAHGPLLNYNFYCLDPEETEEAKRLNQDFFDFLDQCVTKPGLPEPVKLAEGDAVFFQDERLIHGRNAFEASREGERLLWKAGFKFDLTG